MLFYARCRSPTDLFGVASLLPKINVPSSVTCEQSSESTIVGVLSDFDPKFLFLFHKKPNNSATTNIVIAIPAKDKYKYWTRPIEVVASSVILVTVGLETEHETAHSAHIGPIHVHRYRSVVVDDCACFVKSVTVLVGEVLTGPMNRLMTVSRGTNEENTVTYRVRLVELLQKQSRMRPQPCTDNSHCLRQSRYQ